MREQIKSSELTKIVKNKKYGPVAQLVRAPPCHGGGRGFESLQDRLASLIIRSLSSAGRAPALQAGCRRFKSCSDHLLKMPFIYARVAESADAQDLKSCDGNIVPVQVWPRALCFLFIIFNPNKKTLFVIYKGCFFRIFYYLRFFVRINKKLIK